MTGDKDKRAERNRDLVRRMKAGESLALIDQAATHFPPRPLTKKNAKDVARVYGERFVLGEAWSSDTAPYAELVAVLGKDQADAIMRDRAAGSPRRMRVVSADDDGLRIGFAETPSDAAVPWRALRTGATEE